MTTAMLPLDDNPLITREIIFGLKYFIALASKLLKNLEEMNFYY